MRQRLAALTLLLLTASSLVAQGPPRGGGGRAGFKVPDPVLFNGPPPPEEFLDLVSLDSTQYDAYRHRYVAFMDQTRVQRDSLLEFRRQMRDAFEAGGMAGGRSGGPAGGGKIQKTLGEMEKQQKAFDETVKTFLSETQYKRYEAWRKDELARAERELRERFGGPPGL